jgi:Uma2 family endonuclease
MMQLTLNQIIVPPGQRLLLTDINWSMFENLLEELGESRATRLSYNDGMVEIMAPLAVHEDDKSIIGNFVEIILEEFDIEFRALGSTTFKNQNMAKAVEPDECFYIEHEATIRGKARIDLTIDPPPDLAIEIDITSRTLFDNYEKLGVPELWQYDGQTLQIHLWQNGQYIASKNSAIFPNIPIIDEIPRYMNESKIIGRNATMKKFRAFLQQVKK